MYRKILGGAISLVVLGLAVLLGGASQQVFSAIFILEEAGVEWEIEGLTEGQVISAPSEAEESIPLGKRAIWELNGREVTFPYTLAKEDADGNIIRFVGRLTDRTISVTIKFGENESKIEVKYGAIPDLPQVLNGYTVSGYYFDDFETAYVPDEAVEDVTLFPLFTDYFLSVTVDGNARQVLYGDFLAPVEDTDTHVFVGFYEGDSRYEGRVLRDLDLTTKLERTRYRVRIGENVVYVNVGENLEAETLSEYGARFYRDPDCTDEVAFPLELTDDTELYLPSENEPQGSGNDNKPTTPDSGDGSQNENPNSGNGNPDSGKTDETEAPAKLYYAEVDCPHGSFEPLTYYAGDIVSFEVTNITSGYVVESILAECNGYVIVTERNGNVATFVAPDGVVYITVIFAEDKGEGNGLTTGEIVAIVVSALFLIAVFLWVNRRRVVSWLAKFRRFLSAMRLKIRANRIGRRNKREEAKRKAEEEEDEEEEVEDEDDFNLPF